MFEYKFRPPAAWELKVLTAAQLIQPILDTPSLSPATRLALSGEEIMRNSREQALRSEMEISGALCR